MPIEIPARLQDLPPRWAHFCLGVEQFIRRQADDGLFPAAGPEARPVVVGLSAGVDSTALLLVLHYLSPRLNIRPVAAHLHHGLRKEADGDADAAAELCSSLSVPFVLEKADTAAVASESGAGVEETGRALRYALFERLRHEYNAGAVATGHHLDDLAEDVLMRLTRGTGWPALSGMPGWDARRCLIRPFLHTPKKQLTEFCRAMNIRWREDESNADLKYTRNRFRHEIIPVLKAVNPGFLEAVAGLWTLGREDERYWDETAAASLNSVDEGGTPLSAPEARRPSTAGAAAPPEGEGVQAHQGCKPDSDRPHPSIDDFPAPSEKSLLIPANSLLEAHRALRLRLYKRALDRLGPGQSLLQGLLLLDEAWRGRRTGKILQFPGEKTARVCRDGILFLRQNG